MTKKNYDRKEQDTAGKWWSRAVDFVTLSGGWDGNCACDCDFDGEKFFCEYVHKWQFACPRVSELNLNTYTHIVLLRFALCKSECVQTTVKWRKKLKCIDIEICASLWLQQIFIINTIPKVSIEVHLKFFKKPVEKVWNTLKEGEGERGERK